MTSLADPTTITRLRAEFDGRLIGPDDDGYDEARAVFMGWIDGGRRDRTSRRRGGCRADRSVHGTPGWDSPSAAAVTAAPGRRTDGGIVLDLREMKARGDRRRARTAWAETGAYGGRVHEAAASTALSPGSATPASVGIGGITLAGIGFLARKHGLTIDSLLAAEVVTADGRARGRRRAVRHPDLFWAIRAAAATSASRPG